MTEAVSAAVATLNDRLAGNGIDGSIKLVIEGEGAVVVDGTQARAGDHPADCTLTADAETFRDMLDGALDPTAAFMSGRLRLEGDMGLAMKLASLLA